MQVTVQNGGAEEAAALSVALYEVWGKAETPLDEAQGVESLAAGMGITLDFAWTPQEAGDYMLRAVRTAGGEETDAELAVSVAGQFAGLFGMTPLVDELNGDTGDRFWTGL